LVGNLENPSAVWRLTLMSGLFPAIPLIIIRPFLPESPQWQTKSKAGQLKRPSIAQLFSPELRRVTIISTILVGCGYGLAFGAIQQIPQIIPGLQEVKKVTSELPPAKVKPFEQKVAATYTKFQEFGGLAGRFLLALLVIRIASRRKLLAIFVVPTLFLLPLLFLAMSQGKNVTFATIGGVQISMLSLGVMLVGLLVVGQFSFWGNYLPRVFPLHLRGTGESMAANIGGRMIGTSFAWVTATLAAQPWFPGTPGPSKIALVAACVGGSLALIACVLLFLLPEPPPEEVSDAVPRVH
jgi:hypothetical protein